MSVDADGSLANRLGDPAKTISVPQWGEGLRLPNIDVPFMIGGVGEVKLDASQLVVLFLHESQPKPITCQKEPSVPIDIEALLSVPPSWTTCFSVFLTGEPGMVWEYIGCDSQ